MLCCAVCALPVSPPPPDVSRHLKVDGMMDEWVRTARMFTCAADAHCTRAHGATVRNEQNCRSCYVHIAEATGTRRLHPRVGALCGSRSISVRSSGSFPRLVTFTLAGANQTVAMDFLAVQIAAPPGVPRAKPVLCGSGRVYDCTTTRVGRIHSLSSSWKPKSHQRLSTSSSESFSLPKC